MKLFGAGLSPDSSESVQSKAHSEPSDHAEADANGELDRPQADLRLQAMYRIMFGNDSGSALYMNSVQKPSSTSDEHTNEQVSPMISVASSSSWVVDLE